jgi:hypothetical protein
MRVDQAWARAAKRIAPPRPVPLEGEPRIALLTVNFSTTRYLKLMLLTLSEQQRLELLRRIVVVDNGSRDGGRPFLRRLDEAVAGLHLVERRRFLHHAAGARAAVRALDRVDARDPAAANLLLFCDPDVVWRDRDALGSIADEAAAHSAAILGESRPGDASSPDIQASFLLVGRDVYARRDVAPVVHHGSPTLWLQRSVCRAGLTVVDFPSNRGGHILHRGRTGVAAAGTLHRWHQYARVANRGPHYMGVPGGEEIWLEIEAAHAALLEPSAEAELIGVLAQRFAGLSGTT